MSESNQSIIVSPFVGDRETFWHDGFLVLRNVFCKEEIDIVKRGIDSNVRLSLFYKNMIKNRNNGIRGAFSTIFVWNNTSGDDMFSKIVRRSDVFDRLEYFFDDLAYVYHNKVVMKGSGIEGFRYHQDYSYWYNMGCLRPDMASTFFAIDPATKVNGCLKILAGSHHFGRQKHKTYDSESDTGIDEIILEHVRKNCEELYIELDPGDCVIFHGNTLHGSDDNTSDQPRISVLGTYNFKRNNPIYEDSNNHPFYHEQKSLKERIDCNDQFNFPDFDITSG